MKKIVKITVVSVLILSIVCIQSPCFAQNMLRKLGRGVANLATGAFEIPKSIQEKFFDEGPIAAGTYGVLDGVCKFVMRTVSGVYEIISFPVPFPADYGPIVEPEFLFSPDDPHGFGE